MSTLLWMQMCPGPKWKTTYSPDALCTCWSIFKNAHWDAVCYERAPYLGWCGLPEIFKRKRPGLHCFYFLEFPADGHRKCIAATCLLKQFFFANRNCEFICILNSTWRRILMPDVNRHTKRWSLVIGLSKALINARYEQNRWDTSCFHQCWRRIYS